MPFVLFADNVVGQPILAADPNAAEVVGQTPWSARDAPVPLPAQRGQHLAEREQADEGVGRGPGGPPHSMQGTGH